MTATPYGDAADCILSDAPGWLLDRYAVVVVAGELQGGAEVRDKLAAYAGRGGRVVITAGNLAKLPGGLAGIRVREGRARFGPATRVRVGASAIAEERGFSLCHLDTPAAGRVAARCGDQAAAVEVACGEGSVIVPASPFGVCEESTTQGGIENAVDKPLARPFPLLAHVRAVLDGILKRERLFEAGEGLSLITCRKGAGAYTLGVCNNTLEARGYKIVSHCGPIESVRELALDPSEKGAAGYLPDGSETADIGSSGPGRIAGGDVRIFSVRVREENVEEIVPVVPPPRPHGRLLPLRATRSIKEAVLERPTFFEHFDGVVVDWKYLREREKATLRKEAGWITRQRLGVVVDLTSGVNLYPDLRLVDNIKEDHSASMEAIAEVLAKMEIVGARDLLLSLHRRPENNFTAEQTHASFVSTLRTLCRRAKERKVTIHLRLISGKPPRDPAVAVQIVEQVGAGNLRLAPSTGVLLAQRVDPANAAKILKGKVDLWLVSRSRVDVTGRVWDVHAPIAGGQRSDRLAAYLSIAPDARIALDAIYRDLDEEYRDARALDELVRTAKDK